MYIVSFETKKMNKKLLKSVKGLKSKKGYDFSQVENILSEIYQSIGESTMIYFNLIDEENELNFEKFKIVPGVKPNLLKFLIDEIISSGHEDSQEILKSVEQQYNNQVTNAEPFFNSEKSENAGKKKSLLSGFSSILKNKKSVEDNEPVFSDFSELDSLDDSKEESSEEVTEEVTEEATEEPLYDNEEEAEEEPKEEPEEEIIVVESFEVENYENDVTEKEIASVDIQKKHDLVTFPSLDNYLDLMPVSNVVDRITSRIREENLIGLLGIETSSALTELEEYQLRYAKKSLSNSKFKFLFDGFNESIKSSKEEFQSELSNYFNDIMLKDYETMVENSLDDKFTELKAEANDKLNHFSEKMDLEEHGKLEKFEIEQNQAFDNFKADQELSKIKYVNELTSKKESRLDIYADTLQSEMTNQKEELFSEELYHEKIKATNQLTEQKRLVTNNFIENLEEIEEDSWSEFKVAIADLEKEITDLLPQWEVEIEKKRKLQSEEREEKRKQEELALKRQEIELERQKLNKNISAENMQEAEAITALVERKLMELNNLENQALVESEKIPLEKTVNGNFLEQFKGKPNKTVMTGVAIALLALGGSFLGGKVAGSSQFPEDATNYNTAGNYRNLEEMILSLEKKISEQDLESTTESLEMLLNEKKYDRAMSLYKDPESVAKIEDFLYINRDLSALVVFNKTFDTVFGKLDESILSKDSKKVVENYKSLSEKDKNELNVERKSDIALHLFKEGEEKLANELLK